MTRKIADAMIIKHGFLCNLIHVKKNNHQTSVAKVTKRAVQIRCDEEEIKVSLLKFIRGKIVQ